MVKLLERLSTGASGRGRWRASRAGAFVTSTIGALVLTGCGDFSFGPPHTQEAVRSLEGVKLIHPAILNSADPMAFGQPTYRLDDQTRLLLRFESLNEYASAIATGGTHRIELLLYPTGDLVLPEGLRICPVAKNWMMLATWRAAHPFGGDGPWLAPGGDFHPEGCQEPVLDTGDAPEEALVFDLSAWYRDYPEAREENFGWILLASNPYEVFGETSSSRSPRVRFDKYVSL